MRVSLHSRCILICYAIATTTMIKDGLITIACFDDLDQFRAFYDEEIAIMDSLLGEIMEHAALCCDDAFLTLNEYVF